MIFNDPGDLPQIMRPETMIARQTRRRQPELGIIAAFCNVNVRRFAALFSVKVKLIAINSEHCGHFKMDVATDFE